MKDYLNQTISKGDEILYVNKKTKCYERGHVEEVGELTCLINVSDRNIKRIRLNPDNIICLNSLVSRDSGVSVLNFLKDGK